MQNKDYVSFLFASIFCTSVMSTVCLYVNVMMTGSEMNSFSLESLEFRVALLMNKCTISAACPSIRDQ